MSASIEAGIKPRHARSCPGKRADLRCCKATYQASVWDAKAGKRIWRSFPTRSAAKRWRQDAYSELRSGALSADRGLKFEDAVERLIDGMRSGRITTRSGHPAKPATVRGYKSRLYLRAVPRFKHLRLGEVERRDVRGLIEHMLDEEFATSTIDGDITPLSVLFNDALDREEVPTNPVHWRDAPAVVVTERRVVPYAVALDMLAALEAGAERTSWAIAILAGLRMGEMSALGREDIDLGAGVIHVRRNWDAVEGYVLPKNRKARTVPIAAALRDHVDQYLLSTDRDEHIFGTPPFVNRATHRARKRWEAAGLPIITLHEARHTYASLMIAARATTRLELSMYMGHATTRITEDLYGHLFEGAEAEAAARFDTYLTEQTVAQTVAHTEVSAS
jgi:integrase